MKYTQPRLVKLDTLDVAAGSNCTPSGLSVSTANCMSGFGPTGGGGHCRNGDLPTK